MKFSEGRIVILSIALLLLCFPFIAFTSHVEARETITCGKLDNPVTIDGKWTSEHEWVDAFQISIGFIQGSGEAYFKAKHDDNYLYALIDFVSDIESQEADTGAVVIDSKNNGGSTPQTDDFVLLGRWNSPTEFNNVIAWGTGTAWGSFMGLTGGFKVACSKDAANDPYSSSAHLIYEFQIPMSELDPTGIGIYAAAFDREVNRGVWPSAPMENPSQYGYMKFTTQVIPEFSTATSMVLLLLLGVASLVLRYPKAIRRSFYRNTSSVLPSIRGQET